MVNMAITHSQGVAGAGATAAGTAVAVGTVTLPRPGPWNIWGIWYTTAGGTPTDVQQRQIFLEVDDINADLVPTPTPYRFPLFSAPAIAGDSQLSQMVPWMYKPTAYRAAGNAQIRFNADIAEDETVAARIAAGVFYGIKPNMYDVMAQDVIANHYQAVEGTADTNAETSAGTITLSEKAKLITGITVDAVMATSAEGDELSGTMRIASDDVDLAPAIYPLSHVTSAPLESGEATLDVVGLIPKMIPVHIPVPQGARIEFLTDLDQDIGVAAITRSYISYM